MPQPSADILKPKSREKKLPEILIIHSSTSGHNLNPSRRVIVSP